MLRKKPTKSKQQLLLKHPANHHENEIVNKKTNQPDSAFVFPKTAFAKQKRLCQAQWFAEYKWLDYKEMNNKVT